MKAVAKLLMVIAVVLLATVVIVGPGRMVAGAEYPFGVGPWSSTGRYCHDVYEMNRFVDAWHHSDRATLSPGQRVTWLAFEKTLTHTGPHVPRADFTAWYRTTGNVKNRMTNESALINTWWNKNCTDPLIEVPESMSHAWSGLVAKSSFVHYPKNVIHIKDFFKVIR